MNECVWLVKDEQCGEPAHRAFSLMLCDRHELMYRDRLGSTARQSASHHEFSSFPGLCYVAKMSDGYIKIGYSNTRDTLTTRLNTLTKEGLIELWAILDGGFVREAVLHHQFKKHRVPGNGERFEDHPDLHVLKESYT